MLPNIFTEWPSFVVHNIYIFTIVRIANKKSKSAASEKKQEQLQVLRIMAVAGAALEDLSGRLATLAPLAEAWMVDGERWVAARPKGKR